jgi:hypothetical protein
MAAQRLIIIKSDFEIVLEEGQALRIKPYSRRATQLPHPTLSDRQIELEQLFAGRDR